MPVFIYMEGSVNMHGIKNTSQVRGESACAVSDPVRCMSCDFREGCPTRNIQ